MKRDVPSLLGLTLLISGLFLGSGCGDGKATDPAAGSISGTVTYLDSPLVEGGEIRVSLWTDWPPAGPPIYSSDLLTGEGPEEYTISGVSFGTYAAVGVEWEPSDGNGGWEILLGMYGYLPPDDLEPDSVSLGEKHPRLSGLEIMADWSQADWP